MGDAMKFWPFRKRENTVTVPSPVDVPVTVPSPVDVPVTVPSPVDVPVTVPVPKPVGVTVPSKQRRWDDRNRDKVRADTRERVRRYRARRHG